MGDDPIKHLEYIHEYEKHKGIHLEYDKIEHNAGLRALAKMTLNSMWGKLGQCLNKTQVHEFDDPQAFHRFLDTDTLDVRVVWHVTMVNCIEKTHPPHFLNQSATSAIPFYHVITVRW